MIAKNLRWILYISLALIWGTSFILIKKGLEVFDPVQVGSIRIIITFLALLPLVFKRFNWPLIAKEYLKTELRRFYNAIETLKKVNGIISYSKAKEILDLDKEDEDMLPYIIDGGKLRKKVLSDAEYTLRTSLWGI